MSAIIIISDDNSNIINILVAGSSSVQQGVSFITDPVIAPSYVSSSSKNPQLFFRRFATMYAVVLCEASNEDFL